MNFPFPATTMLLLCFAAFVVAILIFFIVVLLLLRLIELISGCEIVKPFMESFLAAGSGESKALAGERRVGVSAVEDVGVDGGEQVSEDCVVG